MCVCVSVRDKERNLETVRKGGRGGEGRERHKERERWARERAPARVREMSRE